MRLIPCQPKLTQMYTDVEKQKANGEDYYKLLLVYVDDVLTCSHAPQALMDNLALTYELKEGSVGEITIYIGAEIKKYQAKSGKEHYGMSNTQ